MKNPILFDAGFTTTSVIAAILPLILSTPTSAPAGSAGESGAVCVRDYQAGAICTANDLFIDAVVREVINGCNGAGDTATVVLDIRVQSASPNRFDVGFFIATDGGSAVSGHQCYHDFLAPPLTTTPAYTPSADPEDPTLEIINGTWWNGDSDGCGDLESQTRAITTLPPLTLACVDTNDDGVVDVDLCVSWDGVDANVCADVTDAFPTTNARCRCDGRTELSGLEISATTTTSLAPATTTTTLEPSATTTTTPTAGSPSPIAATVVAIKPGKLFKIIAKGEFALPSEDPTVEGAVLTFETATGGQTYLLPASCWTAASDPSKGYSCSDAICRSVKVKPNLIKAVCKPDTGDFALTDDGNVSVVLRIGNASGYCASCGGTAGGNPDTVYLRKECAAPPACP
jgi:hypothetical protein